MKQEIEKLIEVFFASYESVDFDGYRRFFSERLTLIMPRIGVLNGLQAYLDFEAKSTKLTGRKATFEDRKIEIFGDIALVTGLTTMSFSAGEKRMELRELITFLFERDAEKGWQCFHCQATLAP